jgi:hypothetical protein
VVWNTVYLARSTLSDAEAIRCQTNCWPTSHRSVGSTSTSQATTFGAQMPISARTDSGSSGASIRDDGAQGQAVGFVEVDLGDFAHPPDSHGQVSSGILNRMQMSDFIH